MSIIIATEKEKRSLIAGTSLGIILAQWYLELYTKGARTMVDDKMYILVQQNGISIPCRGFVNAKTIFLWSLME